MNKYDLLLKIWNKLPVLSVIISFILFILICLCGFIFSSSETNIQNEIIFDLYFFIPVAVILLIYFISKKTINKFPKATKIIAGTLDIVVILAQLAIYFFIYCVMMLFYSPDPITNPKQYKKALASIASENHILHFLKKIPNDAKNIKLYQEAGGFVDYREEIYLIFDTTPEFIEQELSKYKYQKIEGPYDSESEYNHIYTNLSANITGFKAHYIILNNASNNYFTFGIATKGNKIMYFYIYYSD